MAVPKRKVSKRKIRMRRGSHQRTITTGSACPTCGEPRLPHRACKGCGTYRGRQVLTINTDD